MWLALGVAALLVLSPSPAKREVPARPAGGDAQAALFGFNDNAVAEGSLSPKDDARLLAGTGANSARITIDWSWVQPRRRRGFHFAQFDHLYRQLLAHGIRPLIVVTGAPAWARLRYVRCPPTVTCHAPPNRAHNRDWAHYVAAVARRYRRAAAIEVWNEPNTSSFFAPRPDPVRYTELLRLARRAAKAVAPTQVVLGGALAGDATDEQTPTNWGIRPFLRAMYANGARGLMDGISIHPYPGTRGDGQVYDVIDTTLEVRDESGDSVPLWLTETGVSTTGPNVSSTPRAYREAAQAQALGDLIPRLLRRPDIRGVYVHTLRDPSNLAPDMVDAGYGVLRADGSRKPAYCAVARARGVSDCAAPGAPPVQSARWDAQERLQAAAETALQHHREAGTYHGLSFPPDSGIEVSEPAGLPDATQLCDRTPQGWKYCMILIRGAPWQFTFKRLDGSVGTW